MSELKPRPFCGGKDSGILTTSEKRLINAKPLMENGWHLVKTGKRNEFLGSLSLADVPTVDAVEVNKYEALVGMYHDLRENFVDYVCSGIRNEAPYCLNKCEECVDKRGWCKLEKCQGFNPAEVILDRYAKMDGDGNG
jgi:hypothetical protein